MSIAQSGAVTGHAGREPGQGPFMRLHLTVCNSVISSAAYEPYSCPTCQHCGRILVELIHHRTLAEAERIGHPDLIRLLGSLPRTKLLCLDLALDALNDALDQLGSRPFNPKNEER